MLNVPKCLECKSIPSSESISAPYTKISELELVLQLYSSSDESIKIDTNAISDQTLKNNTCDSIRSRHPSVKKYCGLCMFYENNILMRLDDEVALLNHLLLGKKLEVDIEIFQYYQLNNSAEKVYITRDIFSIIIENKNDHELLDAILISYSKDIKKMGIDVDNLMKAISSKSDSSDISSIVEKLKVKTNNIETSKKSNEKDATLESLLDLLDSKKKEANEISKSVSIKKPKKKKFKQKVPAQESKQETLNINAPNTNKECEKFQSKVSESDSRKLSTNQLLNELIIAGLCFIDLGKMTVKYELSGFQYSQSLDESDTYEFLSLIFMNSNILKIVSSISLLRKKSINHSIKGIILAESLPMSDNICPLESYKRNLKSLTADQWHKIKEASKLGAYKSLKYSDKHNVQFTVKSNTFNFDSVLITAIEKNLVEKYDIRFSNAVDNSLQLDIEESNKTIIVDFLLKIVRRELKRIKEKVEFEVSIK